MWGLYGKQGEQLIDSGSLEELLEKYATMNMNLRVPRCSTCDRYQNDICSNAYHIAPNVDFIFIGSKWNGISTVMYTIKRIPHV